MVIKSCAMCAVANLMRELNRPTLALATLKPNGGVNQELVMR
jgi:hypothetical protein